MLKNYFLSFFSQSLNNLNEAKLNFGGEQQEKYVEQHSLIDKTFICEKLSKCSVVVVVVFCVSHQLFFHGIFFCLQGKKISVRRGVPFFQISSISFSNSSFFLFTSNCCVFLALYVLQAAQEVQSINNRVFCFLIFFFNFTNATLTLKEVCQKIVMHVVMRPSTCLVNFQKLCLIFPTFLTSKMSIAFDIS